MHPSKNFLAKKLAFKGCGHAFWERAEPVIIMTDSKLITRVSSNQKDSTVTIEHMYFWLRNQFHYNTQSKQNETVADFIPRNEYRGKIYSQIQGTPSHKTDRSKHWINRNIRRKPKFFFQHCRRRNVVEEQIWPSKHETRQNGTSTHSCYKNDKNTQTLINSMKPSNKISRKLFQQDAASVLINSKKKCLEYVSTNKGEQQVLDKFVDAKTKKRINSKGKSIYRQN